MIIILHIFKWMNISVYAAAAAEQRNGNANRYFVYTRYIKSINSTIRHFIITLHYKVNNFRRIPSAEIKKNKQTSSPCVLPDYALLNSKFHPDPFKSLGYSNIHLSIHASKIFAFILLVRL